MPASAPITIPIEIAPAGTSGEQCPRVFRLASRVAVDRLLLAAGLPEAPGWLAGPLRLRLHLPGDPALVECRATAAEVIVGRETEHEHAERRALLLEGLPPEAALRIERYVEERLNVR